MCELLAINAREPFPANPYLEEFFSHDVDNPHGWGIAVRDDDHLSISKGPEAARQSSELAALLQHEVCTRHLVAHIRKATHGVCAHCNSHPFCGQDISGRTWVMAHNGVVINDALLAGYDRWTQGDTDSERVLMFVLDVIEAATMRNGAALDERGLFSVLSSALGQLSNGNKLNLILDDGTTTYIHTNTRDVTLYMMPLEGACVVSTKPLGLGGWLAVPQRQLVALRNGEVVAESAAHDMGFSDDALHALLGVRKLT